MESEVQQRVKAARAYADLSRKQLAEALDMSVDTLQRIEAGTRKPKKIELLGIENATGVPLWFLETGFAVLRDEAHRSSRDPFALADRLRQADRADEQGHG